MSNLKLKNLNRHLEFIKYIAYNQSENDKFKHI